MPRQSSLLKIILI